MIPKVEHSTLCTPKRVLQAPYCSHFHIATLQLLAPRRPMLFSGGAFNSYSRNFRPKSRLSEILSAHFTNERTSVAHAAVRSESRYVYSDFSAGKVKLAPTLSHSSTRYVFPRFQSDVRERVGRKVRAADGIVRASLRNKLAA